MNVTTLVGTVLASAAAVAATPATAAVFFNATTLASPTYHRVVAATSSSIGPAVHYQTTAFTVSTSGNYVFLMGAIFPFKWDTFLTLYGTKFNPASPLTNVLAANDDKFTVGLSGFTANLTAGVSYFAVASGFSSKNVGAYFLTINGPGTVSGICAGSAVPEPTTWALMIVGLGLVGGVLRRRATVRTRVRFV